MDELVLQPCGSRRIHRVVAIGNARSSRVVHVAGCKQISRAAGIGLELVALLREVAHLRSGPAAIVRNYVRSLLFQGLLLVLLL